jgi:hypothetical protein
LCLSASFNSTVHQLLASLADFHPGYLFRLSNYTIVLVASLGECGFQESLEVLWDHCKRIGQCSPMKINDNIQTKMFTITNAMLEAVTVVSFYGKNGWSEEVAVYEGGRIGNAIGTIVRAMFGLDKM